MIPFELMHRRSFGPWCVGDWPGFKLEKKRKGGWVVEHLPNVKKFGEISLDKVKS